MMKDQRDYLIGFVLIIIVSFLLSISINNIQSVYTFRFFEMFGMVNIIFYTYILFNINKFKN